MGLLCRVQAPISISSFTMADSKTPEAVVRSPRPVSEALLNEKVGISFISALEKGRCFLLCLDCDNGYGNCFVQQPKHIYGVHGKRNIYSVACTIDSIAELISPGTYLVGPRHLLHAHPLLARPRLRCRLLRSSVQATGVACVGWSGFRCWQGVGRG